MSDRIRIEEPGYVARYRSSRRVAAPEDTTPADDSGPSYLRAYRRSVDAAVSAHADREGGRDTVGTVLRRAGDGRQTVTRSSAAAVCDIHLVRHGEAVGDDTDTDLTDQGVWQAVSYGRTLAASCRDGETVVLRHGDSLRARRTVECIRDGLRSEVAARGCDVDVVDPEPVAAFGNLRFVGPDGVGDVTDGFRLFHERRAELARLTDAERPLWLAELDRFWKVQLGGGDPIELWLSIPMLHFEPPALVVRRFWTGLMREAMARPGSRLVVAAHSGCIRALAFAALGYDPGDLYNLEAVRAQLTPGRAEAVVSHRNRNQEIVIPELAGLPVWNTVETWRPPRRSASTEHSPSNPSPATRQEAAS